MTHSIGTCLFNRQVGRYTATVVVLLRHLPSAGMDLQEARMELYATVLLDVRRWTLSPQVDSWWWYLSESWIVLETIQVYRRSRNGGIHPLFPACYTGRLTVSQTCQFCLLQHSTKSCQDSYLVERRSEKVNTIYFASETFFNFLFFILCKYNSSLNGLFLERTGTPTR